MASSCGVRAARSEGRDPAYARVEVSRQREAARPAVGRVRPEKLALRPHVLERSCRPCTVRCPAVDRRPYVVALVLTRSHTPSQAWFQRAPAHTDQRVTHERPPESVCRERHVQRHQRMYMHTQAMAPVVSLRGRRGGGGDRTAGKVKKERGGGGPRWWWRQGVQRGSGGAFWHSGGTLLGVGGQRGRGEGSKYRYTWSRPRRNTYLPTYLVYILLARCTRCLSSLSSMPPPLFLAADSLPPFVRRARAQRGIPL